ncbi:MAG: hypothetical protein CSA20_03480 [Deltaproteobacteria bacterium]|nr:MAG: hypothetical protein CSB23_02530 [Deltaproteobacteria bacterium]PIE73162.1 MAG: hypothetical protein CSA20_03480 [Deltaproteobacteria bacterium]
MRGQEAVKFVERRFQPVVENCDGCGRIVEEEGVHYCRSYSIPEAKWRVGICNFATHKKPEMNIVKSTINPLKAAKRSSKKK